MITFTQKTFSWNSLGDPVIQLSQDLFLKKVDPPKFFQWLGKVIRPIGKGHEKSLYYDIIKGTKEIGGISAYEIYPGEDIEIEIIPSPDSENKDIMKAAKGIVDFIREKGYDRVTANLVYEPETMEILKKLGFRVTEKTKDVTKMTKLFSISDIFVSLTVVKLIRGTYNTASKMIKMNRDILSKFPKKYQEVVNSGDPNIILNNEISEDEDGRCLMFTTTKGDEYSYDFCEKKWYLNNNPIKENQICIKF